MACLPKWAKAKTKMVGRFGVVRFLMLNDSVLGPVIILLKVWCWELV